MLRVHSRLFYRGILSLDLALAGLAFLLLAVRPEMRGAAAALERGWLPVELFALGLLSTLAWPLALEQLDLYSSQRRRSMGSIVGRLVLAGAVVTALLATASFGLSAPVAPIFPVACGLAQLLGLAGLRVAIFSVLGLARRRGVNTRNVLVVGSGPRAERVRSGIDRHPEWGLRVVGFVDDTDSPIDPALASQTIHKLAEFPQLLREQVINEVIVACPRRMLSEIGSLVAVCATSGVPITLLSDLYGDYLPPPKVTRFHSEAALSFAPVHHSRMKLLVKRGIDLAGASALIALSAPVLALSALLIRLTSPGPVLFRQLRCGLNGRPFVMWKLRTMCREAEERKVDLLAMNEMDGPAFKLADDPRCTPVGRVLRRWSLDELPQLWNVLRGDMSLVGPRPALPAEVEQYETYERRRLSMRPGITCIWQVSGRNTITFEDWVKLDVEYIDTWSLSRDLRLLLATLPAVLRGTGAS